jgi:hypothetical protein
MRYSLIYTLRATKILGELPEIPHDLFTLAAYDIADDPYGPGDVTRETAGQMTSRTWALGSMGFIEYEVDEDSAVVIITNVVCLV